jgi:hypothetical protein
MDGSMARWEGNITYKIRTGYKEVIFDLFLFLGAGVKFAPPAREDSWIREEV